MGFYTTVPYAFLFGSPASLRHSFRPAPGLHILNDERRPLGLRLGLPKSGISLSTNPVALLRMATPHTSDPTPTFYTVQDIPVSLAAGCVYGGVPIRCP